MSNGELRIQGALATYELRMPLYEVQHLAQPGDKLFESIQFAGGRLIEKQCSTGAEWLQCTGKYLFQNEVGELNVACQFPSVTVPNHVHMFRAVKATGESEQRFFDSSLTESNLTFRPPSTGEFFLRAFVEGFRRAIAGLTTALFLFAIAMVAQSRRQLLLLAGILALVELGTASFAPVQLSPKFLEAAAALSTAYIAMEKILVPAAGQRWLVVAVLGVFHGLFFRFFAVELSGAPSIAGFAAGLLCANGVWLLPASLLRLLNEKAQQAMRWLLILAGTFWFLYRILMS
jgi:hypothetical protein